MRSMDFNGRAHAKAEKRRQRMVKLRAAGLTYAAIAKRYDISRQRVAQILGKA